MRHFEWVSTALPRRVVLVRMRTVDELCLPTLQTPFGVLVTAFDPQERVAIDRLEVALERAGASPVRGIGGPGADLWEDGILSAVPSLRSPEQALEFYFGGTVIGMRMEVTDFAVLCLDCDDADWREMLEATRGFLSRRVDWRIHAAADAGRNEDVRQAIACGWPIEEFDDDLAETPLHKAARNGHLDIMRMLLAAGADVNRHCEERIGETPLGLVADTCSFELAHLLIDAGADPTIRGWMGLTALDRAARRTDEAGKAVLALLEAHKARPRG
ncbi:MAG TPA: ankyrin repeat domain-containing protein [Planctomycetota bacterium]